MRVDRIKNPEQEGTAIVSLARTYGLTVAAARPLAEVPCGSQASPQAIGVTPLSWEITGRTCLKLGGRLF